MLGVPRRIPAATLRRRGAAVRGLATWPGAVPAVRFVRAAWRAGLGRTPSLRETLAQADRLRRGTTRGELAMEVVRSREHLDGLVGELAARPASDDEAFVRDAYHLLLSRDPDPGGLRHYTGLLAAGGTRGHVVRLLATGDEHVNRAAAAMVPLPNLVQRWPGRFRECRTVDGGCQRVFVAEHGTDFDDLEQAILSGGYYERPGIWGFILDRDKRLMAEMVAALCPGTALEIGCSNGTVLQCLRAAGVDAEGVDISRTALSRADPSVRPHIRLGDVLTMPLPRRYDVVYGLDIFEHLNPNRFSAYADRVRELVAPGGLFLANVPMFGPDPVFGTVFPLLLSAWEADLAANRQFRLLPVDDEGYPAHGHLIWAGSDWWVGHFERAGLHRERDVERALHARYDATFTADTPARRSFLVFSAGADPCTVRALAEDIARTPSMELG
jgi:methyltransferase family protein/uncharacterized protein DUF4214